MDSKRTLAEHDNAPHADGAFLWPPLGKSDRQGARLPAPVNQEGDAMNEWIKASERLPEELGVFEWRMPSIAVQGMVLVVAANMRLRGAGYKDVISPSFDYWDGYRVILPKGLEWRTPEAEHAIKDYEIKLLEIEGLINEPCPFCQTVPSVKASRTSSGGGVFIGASPESYNSFSLKCCGWVSAPCFGSPFELAEIRNQKIKAAVSGGHQ